MLGVIDSDLLGDLNMTAILHINTSDIKGGSARSSYRIHIGLKKLGCKSRLYVGNFASNDPAVKSIRGYTTLKTLDGLLQKLWWWLGVQDVFYLSSLLLLRRTWFVESDIIMIYNMHWNYFSMLVLPAISRKKTIILRLSDQWPMTGHCAYSKDCQRWKSGCKSCPHIDDYPPLRKDKTGFMWKLKKYIYGRTDLVLMAPSKWIMKMTRCSPLLNRFPVYLIPNGVNQQVFRPISKAIARAALDLPANAFIMLCSGNKGLTHCIEAIKNYESRHTPLYLVAFGCHYGEKSAPPVDRNLGVLEDDRILALSYAAADIYVHLPEAENLPNAILESMACGTPVLSWDVGGIADTIVHKKTGYLARYKDISDVLAGIRWFTKQTKSTVDMRNKCVNHVSRYFSSEMEAQSVLNLCVGLQNK